MVRCIAVKAAFASKTLPLPKDGQGHDLAAAQSRLQPEMGCARQNSLAKVVGQDVKRGQEGIGIDHSRAPYPGEDGADFVGARHLLFNHHFSTHTKRLNSKKIFFAVFKSRKFVSGSTSSLSEYIEKIFSRTLLTITNTIANEDRLSEHL
jgi:hypothetical protein